MSSFKFKLVAYFALVAFVPVCGALYGFDTLAKRHESQRIDNRLRADLRAAVFGYVQQLDAAERRALLLPLPVVVARLQPGLDPQDTLVAVTGGVIVGGPHRGNALSLVPDVPTRVVLDRHTYRALLSDSLASRTDVQFAALVPQHELSAAITSSRIRLVVAVAAVLAIFGMLVYMLGSSIVRTLGRLADAADEIAHGRFRERVPVRGRDEFAHAAEAFNRMAAELEQERRRTRELTSRFGKALAATHDVERLLRVIVETMVEATGAEGGVINGVTMELARTGDLDRGAARLELPLTARDERIGEVVLAGRAFDEEQVETASSLAAQASIALENAHLHAIVERQALIDPLTGLANRRSLEASLREELSRAQRFEGRLCLVIADLDHFKAINDRHGHPSGDDVLRAFAQTLKDAVREVDSAGRWGGEEFALILPGTDVAGGIALAERIRIALAAREIRSTNGEAVRPTASFGVACYPGNRDLSTLVAAADEALYSAKRDGRNRVAAAVDAVRR